MKGLNKMSGLKILLLILSMASYSLAHAQFTFNIHSRENLRVDSYSPIQVSVSGKLALCSHSDRGNIILDITGGIPPYTFKWNNNQTSQNRDNLNSGSYTVEITDAANNKHVESIIIQPPFPLILDPVVKKDATCGSGNDGYAKISVKIGRNDYEANSPPYRITWSNGLEGIWEADNLAPGTYTVLVADKYNCDVSISFEIKAASAGITVSGSSQDPTCQSPNSGKISLNVTGGEAPYSYSWSNGVTSKDLSNVQSGVYQVLVKDNKGCTSQASFTLAAPQALTIDAKVSQPGCEGSESGEIELLLSGGKAPFNYLWNTGETSSKILGLDAGTYSVQVTDASGCTVAKQFTLTNESNLRLEILENRSVSCSGKADGGISLQVTGAKGNFVINWSDGISALLQRKDLKAGNYSITVTDESGCSISKSVVIGENSEIQARIETALDVDCAVGTVMGVAWVSIQGGKAPYTIKWNTTSSNGREINFSTSGILKATVTDALGCSVSTETRVDFPNQNTQGSRIDFQYRKLIITSEPEVMVKEEILFESEIAPEFIAWEWEFGDGNKSTEKDPIHTFSEAGEFQVKLTGFDLFGCSTVETNTVQVTSPTEMIVIPNAFSPNGDGLNDTFIPKIRAFSSFQLEVFNTWGEKLFITNSLESKGWDGTYKGQLAPAGNYLYRITLTTLDGQLVNRTGGITLIR